MKWHVLEKSGNNQVGREKEKREKEKMERRTPAELVI